MPQLQTVCIAFALMVSAVSAAAAEQRRHDAHQHGGGRIDVAVEGGLLSVVLEVPAVNLVGFEHAPRGDEQKARVARAVADLEDGLALLGPSPAAECRQQQVEIESALLNAEDHGGADHDHEGAAHADFEVIWQFECERPARLHSLDLTLFERFPGTGHLRLQWISESGQGAARLNAERARIGLTPQ